MLSGIASELSQILLSSTPCSNGIAINYHEMSKWTRGEEKCPGRSAKNINVSARVGA